ncbi:LysR substrate-binding domain-containing protein [Poseidonocella sp. HB161398]|uniref:LysR substrate-binding domain-containing protein n=1 Tax=Poseidonocella sp. HB161398 TaxID=2320855 RepID=UPI001108B48D|nr:LysR substrate-binding domain-containing protein [Poseidonocella sp. HB161398]
MSIPRRFLPSISCLLALEAVDRLGSAVAAAADLSLTHSAVSRQLKALEEQMGVPLLVRDGKGLKLTAAGAGYARAVRGCLGTLAEASLRLRAAGAADSLSLALPPAFGEHWMAPRLFAFMRRHPGLAVHQRTRSGPVDVAGERLDAAVQRGAGGWPGLRELALAEDRLVPVGAPELLPAGVPAPAALLALPLLHLEGRPGAWESWFQQQGVAPGRLRGPLFDRFGALAAAAAAGLGLALLPDFLADKEIAAGRLAAAGAGWSDPASRYWLVWPREAEPGPALRLLLAHLRRPEG